MLQRIKRRPYRVFAYDVESHNDEESIAKKETSIWLSCFIDEESKVTDEDIYFYDIKTWLNRLHELTAHKFHKHKRIANNLLIYIYNLSFEYSFILPVLLEMGFKWTDKITDESEYVFTSVTNKSCASVWNVEFKFGKKCGRVILRDLSKIFPGGLSKVASSFGLPTQKGEIDYRKNRLHDYKVTDEEKEYNFKDVRIIIDILIKMQERNDGDFWTSCSAATYSCKKMIKYGYPKAYKPMKAYRKAYPLLSAEESEFLRKGVAGGITYAPSFYQFKDIQADILHIDIHQAHPSRLYSKLYPYGEGLYFKGEPPRDHFYISACRVRISYSGVKLHNIIKLIGFDAVTDLEITAWNFEIDLMRKCYFDFEVEFIDGYAYRARYLPFRQYFLDNYNKRLEAKKNGDAFEVMYRKLLNNSAYGKFLERGHDVKLENYVCDSGAMDSVEHIIDDAPINAKYTYLPIGSCTAAYTRTYLVETALSLGYKNIVYFDTDSIFFMKNEETEAKLKNIDMTNKLGAWGFEAPIKRGQFTAPKRYKILEDDGKGGVIETYHLAGVNFSRLKDLPAYDDLDIVSGHYIIQGVMRVKGGTIIIAKEKDLGIQAKYSAIAESNIGAIIYT